MIIYTISSPRSLRIRKIQKYISTIHWFHQNMSSTGAGVRLSLSLSLITNSLSLSLSLVRPQICNRTILYDERKRKRFEQERLEKSYTFKRNGICTYHQSITSSPFFSLSLSYPSSAQISVKIIRYYTTSVSVSASKKNAFEIVHFQLK